MDGHGLLAFMESIRGDVPGPLQGAFDDLLQLVKNIVDALDQIVAPPEVIDTGKQHLSNYHSTLLTHASTLKNYLDDFQTTYTGQGSDAYFQTAYQAHLQLGHLTDHLSFAIDAHNTISNNLGSGQIAQGALFGFMAAMIPTAATLPEGTPIMAGEGAGAGFSVAALWAAMQAVGATLASLAAAALPYVAVTAVALVLVTSLTSDAPQTQVQQSSIAVPAHPDWTLPDGRQIPSNLRGAAERLFNDPRIINAFPDPAIRMLVITWLFIAFVVNCGYSVEAIQQLLEAADFVSGLANTIELASNPTGGRYQQGSFRVIQTILSLPFIPDFTAQYGPVTPFNVVGVGVQQFGPNGQTLGDIDLQMKVNGQLLYAEVGGSNKGDPSQQAQFIRELTNLKTWAARDGAKPICFLVEPDPSTKGTGHTDWANFEEAVSIAQAELGPQNVFIVPYANHNICQ